MLKKTRVLIRIQSLFPHPKNRACDTRLDVEENSRFKAMRIRNIAYLFFLVQRIVRAILDQMSKKIRVLKQYEHESHIN